MMHVNSWYINTANNSNCLVCYFIVV